jgi:hypothetical protein
VRAHPPSPQVDPDLADHPVHPTDPDTPAGAAAPANRAARRGRAKGRADSGAAPTGFLGRPRAAQGRRVNPVRRTG